MGAQGQEVRPTQRRLGCHGNRRAGNHAPPLRGTSLLPTPPLLLAPGKVAVPAFSGARRLGVLAGCMRR